METRPRAQDVLRCGLCETAVVQMHCDTCLVNLCTACVGKHMISDESKNHQIVKFQSRKSTSLFPVCTLHTNERCEMYCKHCDTPICTACVASERHISHRISQLFEIYLFKKKEIQQDIVKIRANISPLYDGIMADIQTKMDRLEMKCKEISKSITELGEDWHRKIDIVVNQLQTELTEMKNTHEKILKNHLEEIERDISNINSDLNSSEEILQSNNLSLIFQYVSKVSTLQKSPPHIDVSLPSFTPKEIQQDQILKLFGTLSLTKHYCVQNRKTEEKIAEAEPCHEAIQLLDKPEIITTINTVYTFLENIACQNNVEIWASGDYRTINLLSISQESSLKSRIKLFNTKIQDFFSGPLYIAVTCDGDLVYCDPCARTVNIVENEEVKHTIHLRDWKPRGVCSSSTGDLLVIMDRDDRIRFQSKAVRYSGLIERQTIQFDEEGKPLYPCSSYNWIKYITENRNLDICVADGEAVIVVNQAGKWRFRYSGHYPLPKWNQKFIPRGITTDSLSHILIADEMNKCVHIIDEDGQFLHYIDCGMVKPRGLCIDKEDYLFVANYKKKSGQIIKIKYLN